MTLNRGMFTSDREDWATPSAFFKKLDDQFNFTLDPCASASNTTCARYFNKRMDGLKQDWYGNVFMNPPYGRQIGKWLEKAVLEAQTHANFVICLIPARTDTIWWHEHVMPNAKIIYFVKGRLKFIGAENSAPFPSAVVWFNGFQYSHEPQIKTMERA